MSIKSLWCEAYRPATFDEYIFQSATQKKQFTAMAENKEIPNLLLSGSAGTGKTSLSKLLVNVLEIDDCDVMTINASDNNSVDYIRDKIYGFATSFAIGSFKVIQLEEADYLSINAQAVLRGLLEETQDNCRFILTCNYENKIVEPVKSRLQHFHFKSPSKDEVLLRAGEILVNELIEFELELLEKYVTGYYPDIRKIINTLQQNSIAGKLTQPSIDDGEGDYHFEMVDLLQNGDLRGLRKLICTNVPREEYDGIYRYLYENLQSCPKFGKIDAYEAGIVVVASYLYKNSICADPEINFAACAIELNNI
jgi:DNA polymerase III delta prime subunit